jgi:hypothetical protein
MMKLVIAKPSPFARKARVALIEKGIAFETEIDVPWNPGGRRQNSIRSVRSPFSYSTMGEWFMIHGGFKGSMQHPLRERRIGKCRQEANSPPHQQSRQCVKRVSERHERVK